MKKKRILAVDDDPSALNALRQILTQKGYEVVTAPDAEAGLDLLDKEPVDLALLDVTLPGMSGYDMCRQIRRMDNVRDIPVIFLTARGMVTEMTEGEAAGSDLYLIKPVLATKLINMVGMFLSSDAPLSRKPRVSTTR
jgi:two-component system phosphate regulon response regulator PhoB